MTVAYGTNIVPRTYFEGAVQSLGFRLADGRHATIGVICRAENWDFGVAERGEEIEITSGGITGMDNRFYRKGETLTFNKGDPIRFKTNGPVSYLCIYGD